MQLISDIGSERATNDSGKIITTATHTHVIWQDVSREGYFNRVRSLDHQTDAWTEPFTLDQGIDNHARGVMTIDPDGILHVSRGVVVSGRALGYNGGSDSFGRVSRSAGRKQGDPV
mgnify:FL=1